MIPVKQVQRGALEVIDPVTGQSTGSIFFQFNPSTFTRTLTPRTDMTTSKRTTTASAPRDATRFTGMPTETFTVVIEMDGSDQLPGYRTFSNANVGAGDTMVRDNGISPQIAAIETLIAPTSQTISDENKALDKGVVEVAPSFAPLILFTWGTERKIPVTITQIDVAEMAFDANLNPVRAKVTIRMSVLTASDISSDHKGYKYFVTYQQWKEKNAKLAASWKYNR